MLAKISRTERSGRSTGMFLPVEPRIGAAQDDPNEIALLAQRQLLKGHAQYLPIPRNHPCRQHGRAVADRQFDLDDVVRCHPIRALGDK